MPFQIVIDFFAKGSVGAIDTFLETLEHQTYQVQMVRLSLNRNLTTIPEDPNIKDQKIRSDPTVTWELIASMQIMSY